MEAMAPLGRQKAAAINKGMKRRIVGLRTTRKSSQCNSKRFASRARPRTGYIDVREAGQAWDQAIAREAP